MLINIIPEVKFLLLTPYERQLHKAVTAKNVSDIPLILAQ